MRVSNDAFLILGAKFAILKRFLLFSKLVMMINSFHTCSVIADKFLHDLDRVQTPFRSIYQKF